MWEAKWILLWRQQAIKPKLISCLDVIDVRHQNNAKRSHATSVRNLILCFSFTDTTNAVVEIKQFLVIELFHGDAREETIADGQQQAPPSEVPANTANYTSSASPAAITADCAEQE